MSTANLVKVKLNCSRAGTNFVNHAGDVIELPADEADRCVQSGSASFVKDETERGSVRPQKSERQ